MTEKDIEKATKVHPARCIGQIVQGLFLGIWVPVAIIELVKMAGDFTLFKYQGF